MSSRRWNLAIAAGALLAAACAGCGIGASSGSPPPTSAADAARGIDFEVRVPLMTAATAGSRCDRASLEATGPKSAALPGGTIRVVSMDMVVAVPEDAPGPEPTLLPLGDARLPEVGTVGAIDARYPYPGVCVFTVHVPLSSEAEGYGIVLGEVYLPVPVTTRERLVASGWKATIHVNPQ